MAEQKPAVTKLDFSGSHTVAKFMRSKGFVRGLMGPVGSGKSYACCAELWRRAVQQKPSPRDGIKYSRFAIVRNTHPMLRTTTLKTWMELMPEHIWGTSSMHRQSLIILSYRQRVTLLVLTVRLSSWRWMTPRTLESYYH